MKAAPGCELYGYDFSVNSVCTHHRAIDWVLSFTLVWAGDRTPIGSEAPFPLLPLCPRPQRCP